MLKNKVKIKIQTDSTEATIGKLEVLPLEFLETKTGTAAEAENQQQ